MSKCAKCNKELLGRTFYYFEGYEYCTPCFSESTKYKDFKYIELKAMADKMASALGNRIDFENRNLCTCIECLEDESLVAEYRKMFGDNSATE